MFDEFITLLSFKIIYMSKDFAFLQQLNYFPQLVITITQRHQTLCKRNISK